MKKNIILGLIFTLTAAFTVNAQDFDRLGKLANDLRIQADDLVSRTNKLIKKDGTHSSNEIENAFLAEQLRASTILIKRIIDDRFRVSEVRYAGMVLSDLSERFPVDGKNRFEWKKATDTINELSRELRGLNIGLNVEKAGFRVDESSILGRAVWSGMVDADVQLTVKGDKISAKTMSGREYADGAYTFSSKIPKQSRIRVGVVIKNGRGKVHVMQQPDQDNNYTAVIQVKDEEGGAKPYSLEIYWYRR
ncbi:MAG: hypothetical protein R2681_09295 [Pyrinomonadaceae bacterium]